MLCRMLGDRAQAEELASDTLGRLATRRVPLDRYSNLSGWLYRTATRMGIDAIRAATRRRHYEQMTAAEGSKHTPLDELLQSERSQHVRTALAQLKPGQTQILLLRNQGLSYKEIADALNARPSSVGTLLARAEAAFERTYRRHNDLNRTGSPARAGFACWGEEPASVSPSTAPDLKKETR
jgi:RNA polymerase sigma-70 factor (ECF subfamily)